MAIWIMVWFPAAASSLFLSPPLSRYCHLLLWGHFIHHKFQRMNAALHFIRRALTLPRIALCFAVEILRSRL
jgi:hypothetical protein